MEIKRLLRLRKAKKKPKFKRQELGVQPLLKETWRRPKGRHSKKRRKEKARGPHPGTGYGAPKSVRGLNRSGLMEIRISNPFEVSGLDPKSQMAVISGAVGSRKRKLIEEEAKKLGIKVANA